MPHLRTILPFAFLACLASPTLAAELQGVRMPDTVEVDGKKLKLNGLGVREATMFKVKAYVAGLYVETPSHNAEEILKSPELKRIALKFLRDIDAEKLRSAWKEAFKKNCGEHCQEMEPSINQMNEMMSSVTQGDLMMFTIYPDKVEVAVKEEKPKTIEGKRFARFLPSIWLGDPPNGALKEGLLGVQK